MTYNTNFTASSFISPLYMSLCLFLIQGKSLSGIKNSIELVTFFLTWPHFIYYFC